jgi:hypothetical protein
MHDNILETSRLTDAQGSFELCVSFEQFPVYLVHCAEGDKTPRHHPLVARFLGKTQCLFAQSLHLRKVVPRVSQVVIGSQISERLAFALSIPRGTRVRAHALRFSNRLWTAREEQVDLASSMIDLRDTSGWHGRHNPWSHGEGTRVKVEGGLAGVGVLRLVTGEDQVIKRLLPVLTLYEMVG